MRTSRLRLIGVTAALAALLVAPHAFARPAPVATRIDDAEDCAEPVPEQLSTPASGDDREVVLDVHFLLDGVSAESANEIVRHASKPYGEIGVRLSPTFEHVSFEASGTAANGKPYIGAEELIKRTRQHVGGFRPHNSDVVYTLTSKELGAGGVGEGVAGLADCVGGVRFPDAAFAVGEAGLEDEPEWHVWSGKVAAHEIAHLLGAQHHYANCAEGDPEAVRQDLTPCTLMFNDVLLVSLRFATLEASVTRGHALAYAADTPSGPPPMAVRSISIRREVSQVHGTVAVDEPVAGCTRWVSVVLQTRQSDHWDDARTIRTDADGVFRVSYRRATPVRVVAPPTEAHDGESWRTCQRVVSRSLAP